MSSHERWLSKFQIKDKTWVFVPTQESIEYGHSVKALLEKKWTPPDFYFHLRNGGHVHALKEHIQHKFFLKLDVQNFFGSINKSRVTRHLKKMLSYDSARRIANESTVRVPDSKSKRYILPFGFVQSSIIASICFSESALGRQLEKLNRASDISVSVYVDDIILSSDNCPSLMDVLQIIQKASTRSGFFLNDKKQEGPGHTITAFNIHLSQGEMRLTRERLELLKKDYRETDSEYVRSGIVAYVKTVNEEQAREFGRD